MKRLLCVIGVLCWIGFDLRAVEFTDEEKKEGEELVAGLRAEGFAEREAAMKGMEDLPLSALPWLEEQIEKTAPQEIELRSRLKTVIRVLKKRDAVDALAGGTAVKLDMKDVSGDAVLEALEEQVGVALYRGEAKRLWKGRDPSDFAFEGTFWEAVEAMKEVYPLAKGERENLGGGDYRLTSWNDDEFRITGQPVASQGVLRVRQARMALENNGGEDYLVMTLVPTIEPCYQVEGLRILIRGLVLEDGTVLEPEQKIQDWKVSYNGSQFDPGGNFSWSFPLKKGTVLGRVASFEGMAKVNVRRLGWAEVELPKELNEAVKMSSNVKLTVLERDEGRLKIQFEGEGSEPANFDDYEMRKEAYQILDEEGERLEFNVSSSSSGGGNGWRNSYGGKIVGEPARVRASLPGGEQEVELEFDLAGLPMPGSSLLDGVEEGKVKLVEIEIRADGVLMLDGEDTNIEDLEPALSELKEEYADLAIELLGNRASQVQKVVEVVNLLAKLEIKNVKMRPTE